MDAYVSDISSVSWATNADSIDVLLGDTTIQTYTLPAFTILPASTSSPVPVALFIYSDDLLLGSIDDPKNYWTNKNLHFDQVNSPSVLTLPQLSTLPAGAHELSVAIIAANDDSITDTFTLTINILDCSSATVSSDLGTSTTLNYAGDAVS